MSERSYTLSGLTKEEYEKFSAIIKENQDNEKRKVRACNAIAKVEKAIKTFLNNGGRIRINADFPTKNITLVSNSKGCSEEPEHTFLGLCDFYYDDKYYDLNTVQKYADE